MRARALGAFPAGAWVTLLLDEHYADEIAAQLRAAGHDATTVSERGMKGIDDEALLHFAASEERALLTKRARLPTADRSLGGRRPGSPWPGAHVRCQPAS